MFFRSGATFLGFLQQSYLAVREQQKVGPQKIFFWLSHHLVGTDLLTKHNIHIKTGTGV